MMIERNKTLLRLGKIGHNIITVLIFLNFLVIALSTYPQLDAYDPFFEAFDNVCIYIFVVEIAIRIAFGGKNFWVGHNAGWNWFDFIITLVSAMGTIPALSIFRIARLLRLFMSARFISSFKPLRKITNSIVGTLPSIGWIGLLLLFVDIVYTVIATIVFGQAFPELYGSLQDSFYSMIELMTMEGWNETAHVVMEKFPQAWVFYISYIFIAAYILLNAVTGVLVDGMMSAETAASIEREKEMLSRQDATNARIESLEKKIAELTALLSEKK